MAALLAVIAPGGARSGYPVGAVVDVLPAEQDPGSKGRTMAGIAWVYIDDAEPAELQYLLEGHYTDADEQGERFLIATRGLRLIGIGAAPYRDPGDSRRARRNHAQLNVHVRSRQEALEEKAELDNRRAQARIAKNLRLLLGRG